MSIIKAIIMAGGKGTRLRPLTCSLPKPMVPILNKPVMEYTVQLLKKYNIDDVAVTTAYLSELITEYFEEGQRWDMNISYYLEDVPLGTGGSVRNAEEYIKEPFLVISGDALTDLNIDNAIDYHRTKGSKVTLVLKKEAVPIEYGVVITNEAGKIVRFLEKPSWGEVFSNTVNTGIYIIEPEVMNYYKKGDNFDFSKDLFPKLLQDGVPMYGYVTEDYWCDIGDLNSYKQTQFDILDGKVNLELDANEITKGVWLGEGTKIHEKTVITPPVYIGKNSLVDTCRIGPHTIISDNCDIKRDAVVKRSIIWKDSHIGEETHFTGAVACNRVHINKRVNVFENAAIGEESTLLDGVMVKPDIKIWPHKRVDENTVVNKNLIWGSKASKTVFGYRDISGHMNIDITPEFAMGLGSSFSAIAKGGAIVVSDDASNAAFLIKSSIITGIHASGGQVIEVPDSILAMNRFAVKYHQADGGVHIRTDNADKNKIYIEFIDNNGANISRSKEREIENLMNRGDFERCNADKLKQKVSIENFSSIFIKQGLKLLQHKDALKRRNFKIAISSNSLKHLKLAKDYLNELGCSINYEKYEGIKPLKKQLSYLSNQIKFGKAEFGVLISDNGEDMIIVDEKGRSIEKEDYLLLTSLIALKSKTEKIVLPYIVPNIFEKMAKSYNVEVIRTKSNPSSIMHEMLKNWNINTEFPLQYTLNYNAIWSIGLILDLLVSSNSRICNLVDEFPEYYYLKEEIPCDWKDKGRVIKELIEENKDQSIELFEGVKINDDRGWTLILPDHEKPLFNIYTEGFSQEYAQELSVSFSKKVKDLLSLT